MSTLMTTQTPGMVSPTGAAPFTLDAIRRQVRHLAGPPLGAPLGPPLAALPGPRKQDDDDLEDGDHRVMMAGAASQDVAGLNGDCEEDAEDAAETEEGCSGAEDAAEGDDEAPRQPCSDDGPRRNKRKNFKPRNILYDDEQGGSQQQVLQASRTAAPGLPAPGAASDSDGDDAAEGAGGRTLGHSMHVAGVKRRSRKPLFAPQKRYAAEEGAPRFGVLDLSCNQDGEEREDDSSAFGEDDDSRSSYPALNHLNSGPDDEGSDVNLSDGGGSVPSASMLSRNHLLKPRAQARHLDRDRDSSSAADGDSSLDLSGSDSRLFGRQVFGAPDDVLSSRGSQGSPPPGSEDAADLSRPCSRDFDAILGGAMANHPLGSMAAQMAAAAAFRRHQAGDHQGASAMKEFAEKTMRELLGIYGLGGEIGEPLPMASFNSGKILDALSAGGGAVGALNLNLARAAAAQQRLSSSPPSQPPTPPRTPLSPHGLPTTTPHPPKSDSPQQSPSTGTPPPGIQQQQGQQGHTLAAALHAAGLTPAPGSSTEFEDFRGKLADNMAKLTGLSASSIMNDPRVMLPQNLQTILTLAALQDQGVAAKSIRTPTLPLLDPKSGGLLQGMPSLAAASGLASGGGAASAPGGAPGKSAAPIDYSRYVKRFGSALECGRAFCKDLNYREHFHCIECNSRVFVKKEEMIRHFKWHKKRAESLAHGFMRYSPNDDCSDRYRDCSHNRKQTHYHCIKENCDKVYISTSDVQMHANYHRKDSAIIQEGFQRYRATEECRTEYCVFFGQRTTHFHCRREGCKYTFKNKADMEKHKTYHIKDEQLTRDGFKKFMKQDPCPFEGCRFSGNCNHIHCIRSGCSYVLHSSGQLFSHKRKHERKDSELAYRKYKLAQSMMKSLVDGQAFADQFGAGGGLPAGMGAEDVGGLHPLMAGLGAQPGGQPGVPQPQLGAGAADRAGSDAGAHQAPHQGAHPLLALQQHMPAAFRLPGLDMLPPPYMLEGDKPASDGPADLTRASRASPTAPSASSAAPDQPASWHTPQSASQPSQQSPQQATGLLPDEALWQRVSWRFSERCAQAGCEAAGREHWHCRAEGCAAVLRAREAVLEHARNHDAQDQVSEAHYVTVGASPAPGSDGKCHCDQDCPYQDKEKHYHCTWENCREIILPSDTPFRRLDHFKMHEYSRKLSQSRDPLTTMHLASSIDAMFRRKRGRPPKNRVIEVWNDYMSGPPGSSMPDTPQAIFTSFKLPKPSTPQQVGGPMQSPMGPMGPMGPLGPRQSPLQQQLQQHQSPVNSLFGPSASPPAPAGDEDPSAQHRSSSPNTLELLQEGFMLFDGDGNRCGDSLCTLSGRRHFHCKQPRCFYATDREDVLLMHARDFHDNVDILPGFVFFDRSIDCRLPGCPSNRANRHFHCTRPACGYSFVRYLNMAQHEAKHRGEANNNNQDGDGRDVKTELTPIRESKTALCPPYCLGRGPAQPGPRPDGCVCPSVSPVGSPLTGCGPAATPPTPPTCRAPTPGTPRSGGARPPSNPHQAHQMLQPHQAPLPQQQLDQARTTDIVKTDPDAAAGSHSLARLLQQHGVKGEAPAPPSRSRSPTPQPPHQHPSPHQPAAALPEWMSPERHVRYGPEQSCSRPFCKLKRKEHYHCNACNQAFSELDRLRPHIAKHSTGALSPGAPVKREGAGSPGSEDNNDDNGEPTPQSTLPPGMPGDHQSPAMSAAALGGVGLGLPPPGLHGSPFPPQHFNAAMAAAMANQQLALMTSQGLPYLQGLQHPAIYSSPSGLMFCTPSGFGAPHPLTANGLLDPSLHQHLALKRSMQPHMLPGHQDMSPEAKKARIQNSMRILKDEPVPDGYIRFRFNEDCKYPHCGYREHQTHFHCMRKDCGYSFCDKTRFVQHTARHERLDTLMGGDFQQFRANVSCHRPDCVYTSTLGAMQNKASHFHCLKCEFVCTDTNKVVAHRRQHQKLDSIMAAGFEKFTPSQPCHSETCAHSGKQTHYHCLSCQYAVLGLSQMSAHKFRHME